jgi:ABC-2 type transport system permease protein
MNRRARYAIPALREYRGVLIFLRQLRVLIGKELVQLWRDRPLLIFIVYIFSVNIVTAARMTTDLHDARILVHDADHSQASRDLLYRFRLPYFNLAGETATAEEGLRALDRGEAVAFLDIPERFEERLRRGVNTAKIQMHVDTSKANKGYLASSYGAAIVSQFAGDWARQQAPASSTTSFPVITNSDRVWFNPDMNDSWFNAIAQLLTMMTVACILLPASAMVREKERGTIEQLLVSPLTPFSILLPKVLAMTLVMLAGVALAVFGIMGPLFHVPMRGSLLLFFLFTALYSITTAGLGLAASTFARNSAQVGMMVLLLVMPIIVLSGTWTPIESLPQTLQLLTELSPLRHFIAAAYGILLRGEGIDTLWLPALAMAVLGAVLFAVSISRFRRQFH